MLHNSIFNNWADSMFSVPILKWPDETDIECFVEVGWLWGLAQNIFHDVFYKYHGGVSSKQCLSDGNALPNMDYKKLKVNNIFSKV